MARQIEYQLFTDNSPKMRNPQVYDFDRTKGIEISVRKDGFIIRMSRYKTYLPEEVLIDRTFRDAIKKAYLLQIVQYGKCCNVKNLMISINGEVSCMYIESGDELLYPLCGYSLNKPLGKYWRNKQVLGVIANTPKSKYDRRFAALFAFAMARSKVFETERFMYLWMAVNSLYGHVSGMAKRDLSKEGKDWIKKEYAQIKFFSLTTGYPYQQINHSSTEEDKKENDKLRLYLEKICHSIQQSKDIPSFVNACRSDDRSNWWVNQIHELLDEYKCGGLIHPYMLMLLWFPYQIRCKYFHGEMAIPFLCYKDEHPLPALQVINHFLDEFLDNNLPHWFEQNNQEEVIKKIASACVVNKKGLNSCSIFPNVKIQLYF